MSRKLCMIPGPVELDEVVRNTMSTHATSHVDPGFIETFGSAIELLRKVFFAPVCAFLPSFPPLPAPRFLLIYPYCIVIIYRLGSLLLLQVPEL